MIKCFGILSSPHPISKEKTMKNAREAWNDYCDKHAIPHSDRKPAMMIDGEQLYQIPMFGFGERKAKTFDEFMMEHNQGLAKHN